MGVLDRVAPQNRLSFADAAKLAGVTVPTVWRWALKGLANKSKLNTTKVGGRRFTTKDDIEAFLKLQNVEAAPSPRASSKAETEAAARGL